MSVSTDSVATTPNTATPAARGKRRRPTRYTFISIASVVVGVGLWWLAAILNPATMPSPTDVFARLVELLSDGTLVSDTLASLRRVLIGFVIGCGLAIPIGFAMGWYASVRAVVEPWIQFFRTIPPLAIIPLAIVLMGIGEVPKLFVITLASFLVSVIATFQGTVNVDRTLINAGRVLGASDFALFRRIVVPASVPFIVVGMRQGLGASWATLVAAELIAAQEGLGYRMQQAQVYYDIATIFVGLVVIGVLGLVMDRALLWADRRLTSWQERR